MRGSPIVRLLFTLMAMGLVLIPLIRLTGSNKPGMASSPPTRSVPARGSEPVDLEITVAGGSARLEVTHLGEIVWQGRVETTETSTLVMNFPQEGIELGILGEFEGQERPAALRVSLTPPGEMPIEKTIWSTGPIDEVLVFERQ